MPNVIRRIDEEMKIRLHLLMPMGGAGLRFSKHGYTLPKPLLTIRDRPFFYWSVKSVLFSIEPLDITFVVLWQHVEQYKIDTVIKQYFPKARIVIIPKVLPGPVFSASVGIESIHDEAPILINDCDHMFVCSKLAEHLRDGKDCLDGALLTFESYEPQFSYVKYDVNGSVVGTIEKHPVSPRAICGAYYFRNKMLFLEIMKEYITACPYSECYLSGMYNVMCQRGMTVKDYLLDAHVEFGTPQEYQNALGSPLFDLIERG